MWSDSETDRDFLNFKSVADIAAEIISQAEGRALSIGVSGSWGVGKSSMLKLLGGSLKERTDRRLIFVEFNAWLYQGFDDTRAALMETIAQTIIQTVEADTTALGHVAEKAKSLGKRVNWFRLAAVSATSVAGMLLGLPPVGLVGEAVNAVKGLTDGNVSREDLNNTESAVNRAVAGAKGLLKDEVPRESPPKAIHAFREELKATLAEMDATLVVLIDDLDRCLPETTIATLEAMRLFLLVERTAFVIAADDKMIREAVRHHFSKLPDFDNDLVTNYFDKLIQVPIRVPPLGTQDVRAYLMLLYIENSGLAAGVKEQARKAVSQQLGETWKGKRVDAEFVRGVLGTVPEPLGTQLDLANRLAPIMVSATKIAGNPRLIKRFLNTIAIRMAIAEKQGITVDEEALAKVLIFERNGDQAAYRQLLNAVNDDAEGKPRFLADWEGKAKTAQAELTLEAPWAAPFVKEWLALNPPLADIDLRGIAYVSRELLPTVSAGDRLSSAGADLLEGLLQVKSAISKPLAQGLASLSSTDMEIIGDRLIAKAKAVKDWGTPEALWQILTFLQVAGPHVEKVTRFLKAIPAVQITAPIVPVLSPMDWASEVFASWGRSPELDATVKNAIGQTAQRRGR
ncbi:MAG: KAP family P-loop NTPase fold protein [Bauldia sp.]